MQRTQPNRVYGGKGRQGERLAEQARDTRETASVQDVPANRCTMQGLPETTEALPPQLPVAPRTQPLSCTVAVRQDQTCARAGDMAANDSRTHVSGEI